MTEADGNGARGDTRTPEVRELLADTARPVPGAVLVVLAALVSLALFLGLRLLAMRFSDDPAPSERHQAGIHPRVSTESESRPAKPAEEPPAASLPARRAAGEKAVADLVERWRAAWAAKDLATYLSFYADSFGAQGMDRVAWARRKRDQLDSPDPIEVVVTDLRVTVRESIVIATFVQTYRSPGYEDRGRKRLYLLPQEGSYRIFNEEWTPLE